MTKSPSKPGHDLYEATLVEIGRITTTWAKFEHWVDVAIWYLSGLDDLKGACITSQLGSIHAKFRALQALMVEVDRPKKIQDEVARIGGKAAEVVRIRNKFAHGPLDMGINLETRKFEVYLKHISVGGRGKLTFDSETLTKQDLDKAQESVAKLYQSLIEHWHEIVDIPRPEEMGR
jgi:hypothetical protein